VLLEEILLVVLVEMVALVAVVVALVVALDLPTTLVLVELVESDAF
jgi:hypothetical protein